MWQDTNKLKDLFSGVTVVLGLLVLRLFVLQVVQGEEFREIAEQNRTQVLIERAPRGRILDRLGRVLADRRPSFVVLFSPLGLGSGEAAETRERLSQLLGDRSDMMQERLETAIRQKLLIRVVEDIPRSLAFRLLELRHRLPGVTLLLEGKRYYPAGSLASHVLGYTGEISPEELALLAEAGYRRGNRIGKAGVERVYDALLRGQEGGFLVEVNARGHHQRIFRRVHTVPGNDLELTLDSRVQAAAEDALLATHHAGAVVAVDPENGRVIALASVPGFDPNVFVDPAALKVRQALLVDEERPLWNRAVQGAYPPGSVFKIVTSLAALERGRVHPDERLECRGSLVVGREQRVFRCWEPHGHGWVPFAKAVAHSCDVYFYQIGLRLGPDPLEQGALRCGFGRLTGVDLPAERKGLVPGRTGRALRLRSGQAPGRRKERHGEGWYEGNTINYAIGQGDLLVTPIQLAAFTALLANRGTLWRPYLVELVREAGGRLRYQVTPRALAAWSAQGHSWELVQGALEEAVEEGTGRACQLPGIRVAGKTGTAQNPHGPDHGLFVAFAPLEHPRVACAVVVEHGEHGATSAAPIARAVIASALEVTTPTIPPVSGGVHGD
ncbi:MAG: penicillin-binding protein 2 [Elusimicrobia bacterium]|nr:penicillin-binding protein 2 [Elusimicrobiota bacterium]